MNYKPIVLLSLIFLSLFYLIYLNSHKKLIVFDVGSSGTRLLIYSQGIPIIQKINPGLSAQTLESVDDYLSQFLATLDKDSSFKTIRIMFYATAGLRLLPESLSTALLQKSCLFFKSRGYSASCSDFKIITGLDEAYYGYSALNHLHALDSSSSVGFIDMGGASSQIAFQDKESLFMESYLGYGLNQGLIKYQKDLSECAKAPKACPLKFEFSSPPPFKGSFVGVSEYYYITCDLNMTSYSRDAFLNVTLAQCPSQPLLCKKALYVSSFLDFLKITELRVLGNYLSSYLIDTLHDFPISWTLGVFISQKGIYRRTFLSVIFIIAFCVGAFIVIQKRHAKKVVSVEEFLLDELERGHQGRSTGMYY